MRNQYSILNKLSLRANTVFENFEPIIPFIGVFGVAWHLAAYVSWTFIFPQVYESLTLRLILIALILPMLLYTYLKRSMAGFYPVYYLLYNLFVTPFFFFFMTLKNEWSTIWTMTTLCSIPVIIMISADLWYIGICLTSAYALAHLSVVSLDGAVRYTHFEWSYMPVFLFTLTGSLIAASWTHINHQLRIRIMKSLGGTIAHEMKAPLNAITIAIDAIRTMLPEQREHTIEGALITIPEAALTGIHDIIDKEAETIRRSNKIIDSILTSLNGSIIDRREFRCCPVVRSILTAIDTYGFDSVEDRNRVHLHLEKEFDFFGDRDLFSHCLFNLLNNALYYRNRSGFRIDISTIELDQSNRIIVRDNGPGVSPDLLDKIFDQFYTYGKSSGNGLGLAFCRRIAESFGGTITCRSVPGEWTEFIFDLPKYDSPKVEQLKQEQLARKQILIVDDQAPNRILLTRRLAEMNCHCDEAANGKIALEMAAKKRYDLILMDIEMPVLNGDEAVRQLRTGEGVEPSMSLYYWEIPIIGVTALPEAEAKLRTRRAGMDGYILKPLGKQELRDIVDRCFFGEIIERQELPLTGIENAAILLVDDTLMTREFLKALLEPLGYRIFQADNGMMAIDMLKELPIDLVIMDLEMPVMGGIAAAEEIRNNEQDRLRRVPIISLSGHTDPKTVLRTKQAGIDLHLGKPVRKHELLRAMVKLMTRERDRQAAITDETSQTSEAWPELGKVQVLDRSAIEGIGDKELITHLVRLFIEDSCTIVGELEEALHTNDRNNALRASHKLKGSAASIGATRLQALAACINDRLHDEDYPNTGGWPERLQEVYAITSEAFSTAYALGNEENA